jgi:hypothetical protein
MPFVHWLPKNLARKWAIRGCIALGIEPKWDWLATATARRKTEAYCAFCMQETFYRPFRQVQRSFSNVGFEVTPVAAEHPALRRLALMPDMLRRILVETPVMLFQTVEILVRKPH